jgi:hypothetical protein
MGCEYEVGREVSNFSLVNAYIVRLGIQKRS